MAHVAPWKKVQVQDLMQVMTDNPVIGLVDIQGIPGPQIQKMRQNLREKATLKISKNRLLLLALEEMETKTEGLIELVKELEGQTGLIATDMNPFKLFRLLESSKAPAPVKGGEVVDEDIEIKAGETPFKPGPIVGELQRAGIPAAIEEGKVVIKTDKVVVKAGEVVSKEAASMLTRLEIYPLTVGLDLKAVFENGVIFNKSDLDIDTQQYIDNLLLGSSNAFNLAVNINYTNSYTVLPLLHLAHSRAINLLHNVKIISPETITTLLSNGAAQMLNLALALKEEALDDELKEKIGSAPGSAAAPAEEKESEEKASKGNEKGDKKEKKEKKKEEKEVSEEEAASGLSQLFG